MASRPPRAGAPRTLDLLVPLAVATLSLAVFAPAVGHGWVDVDDPQNFLQNLDYRGLGLRELRWMLTGVVMGHWTPLTWLTHGLDYVLWGMNPAGYHLGNVLLHAANAALVAVVARRVLQAACPTAEATALRLGAGAAALLFALHPLRVESVAWITERRDVLAALFYLLTVLTWLRATAASGGARRRWYLASLALFALGLLSKSMLVSLPLVLLVLDVYPLRRLDPRDWRAAVTRRVVLEKLPYLALAVGCVAVTALTMSGSVGLTPLAPAARLAIASYSLTFYPWKTLVPLDLRPMYELPLTVSLQEPRFLAPVLIVATVSVALVATRRRWPAGLAVWVAYALTLAPVSGLVHAGPQLVADRFSYLPSLGPCLLLGAGVTVALPAPARRLAPLAAAAWIASMAALSWSQIQIWRDTDTLFTYTLAIDPDCAWCRVEYGGVLGNRGEITAALPHLQRAVALRPHRARYQRHLGLALLRAGRPGQALPHLERAVALQPRNPEAGTYLGLALIALDRPAEALPHLERARAARPQSVEPSLGLAMAYRKLGRAAEADEHLRALRRLAPALAARIGAAPIDESRGTR
jgi:tetratricopeptide (TPR) repeat protein